MMKRYNYLFIPTSVFSEPSGKSTTNRPQMSPLCYIIGIARLWDILCGFSVSMDMLR